jgi:hypothetical protein
MRKGKRHLPKMNGLFDLLQEASVFSNIYHPSGYHQLKAREKDEQKTGIRSREGHFELFRSCLLD